MIKVPKLSVISVLLVASLVTSNLMWWRLSSRSSQPRPEAGPKDEEPDFGLSECTFETEIPDLKGKDFKTVTLSFCQNQIYVSQKGLMSTYSGEEGFALETIETFPELFFGSGAMSDGHTRIPQRLEFETAGNLGTVIVLDAPFCPGSGCSIGTGVYLLNDFKVRRIFKAGSEKRTSWYGVGIYSTRPLVLWTDFDIGRLGCGGCKYRWNNFYRWDPDLGELVLVNDQYAVEMRKLLKPYEDSNRRGCKRIDSLATATLEQLYSLRKDKGEDQSICEGDIEPITTIGQVKRFLQARKVLQRIVRGENLSDADISGQVLVD